MARQPAGAGTVRRAASVGGSDDHALLLERASAAASAAERRAGVQIRDLTELTQLQSVSRLYQEIWRPADGVPPISAELLRAMAKAGCYLAGAFDGTELVGACVGFFSAPSAAAMHSHIAGVSARMRGHSVGFALKVHQRSWALQQDVREIGWTFDPLIRRNAYFNLAKLAAIAVDYLPDFYGPMRDGINGADDTDRLLVSWDLAGPAVAGACAGERQTVDAGRARAAGAVVALAGSDRGPVAGRTEGTTLLVQVPADIEALRQQSPAEAAAWRRALRDTLGALIDSGAVVTGFDPAGWYLLRRAD